MVGGLKMNLGTQSANLGSPLAPRIRRLSVDVDGIEVVGFRTEGRLLVAYCSPAMVQIREYRGERITILGSYAGGRRIGCEQVNGMLVFSRDEDCFFSAPAGKSEWTLYRA
jgi:hypothetical protein